MWCHCVFLLRRTETRVFLSEKYSRDYKKARLKRWHACRVGYDVTSILEVGLSIYIRRRWGIPKQQLQENCQFCFIHNVPKFWPEFYRPLSLQWQSTLELQISTLHTYKNSLHTPHPHTPHSHTPTPPHTHPTHIHTHPPSQHTPPHTPPPPLPPTFCKYKRT